MGYLGREKILQITIATANNAATSMIYLAVCIPDSPPLPQNSNRILA